MCVSGLLPNAKGKISACTEYKKTLIMILSHVSPI